MNFDFSDDQHAIKRTAKDLLADRFKMERVRELAEAGEYDEGVWKELCELGWAGIFIDESYGGQGLGIVELIILMEELGYALAPLPFLSNAAAGLVLQAAGSDEQKERWLPGIASGELRGTVGLVTDGEAKLVPDAATAEVIVLCGHEGTEVVERSDAQIEPVRTMDPTRAFARVGANGAGRPLEGDHLPGLSCAALALAAELTGVSQRAMEMAVEYARDRKQFGRAIGAYQAVSHRCAQMLMEVEGARSATYYGAWTADAEPESLRARGLHGEGLRVRRRLAGVHVVAAGARRDRLHLGARPALLPQAGQGRRDPLRLRARAPRRRRGPVGSRRAAQRRLSAAASGESTP